MSDVCLSVCLSVWRLFVAYIGPKLRTERPKKTKIGTEVAHITRDSDTTFKVKRWKVKVTRPFCLAVLAGQHGHRVSNGSRCVYDVYRVTTCGPERGHIVAASHLQLVVNACISCSTTRSRHDLKAVQTYSWFTFYTLKINNLNSIKYDFHAIYLIYIKHIFDLRA